MVMLRSFLDENCHKVNCHNNKGASILCLPHIGQHVPGGVMGLQILRCILGHWTLGHNGSFLFTAATQKKTCKCWEI